MARRSSRSQELKLLGDDEFPFTTGDGHRTAEHTLAALPAVSGITVNTVHGNERSIAARRRAFHAGGRKHGRRSVHVRVPDHDVPFAQVRAVSNVVERRNRARLEDGRSHPQLWRDRR